MSIHKQATLFEIHLSRCGKEAEVERETNKEVAIENVLVAGTFILVRRRLIFD
jgi:hypothetical protein